MTRRVAAGAGALGVVVVVVSVFVATNGFSFGKRSSERTAVSKYIASVNLVQTQMSIELGDVMHAYTAFTSRRTRSSSATAAQLARAEQTLRLLAMRTSAVPPPPAAARLAKLLAHLLDTEVGVAGEVRRLAVFLPGFRTIGVESRLLSAQLSKALGAVHQPKPHLVRGTKKQVARARAKFSAEAAAAAAAQADAVDAYDRALLTVLAQLRTLVPPPAMAPAYRAQRETLVATRKAGAALAAELRKPKRPGVALLGRKFSEAARIAGSVGSQRAEIAAIRAYDARVKQIGAVELQIQNELSRLAKTLP